MKPTSFKMTNGEGPQFATTDIRSDPAYKVLCTPFIRKKVKVQALKNIMKEDINALALSQQSAEQVQQVLLELKREVERNHGHWPVPTLANTLVHLSALLADSLSISGEGSMAVAEVLEIVRVSRDHGRNTKSNTHFSVEPLSSSLKATAKDASSGGEKAEDRERASGEDSALLPASGGDGWAVSTFEGEEDANALVDIICEQFPTFEAEKEKKKTAADKGHEAPFHELENWSADPAYEGLLSQLYKKYDRVSLIKSFVNRNERKLFESALWQRAAKLFQEIKAEVKASHYNWSTHICATAIIRLHRLVKENDEILKSCDKESPRCAKKLVDMYEHCVASEKELQDRRLERSLRSTLQDFDEQIEHSLVNFASKETCNTKELIDEATRTSELLLTAASRLGELGVPTTIIGAKSDDDLGCTTMAAVAVKEKKETAAVHCEQQMQQTIVVDETRSIETGKTTGKRKTKAPSNLTQPAVRRHQHPPPVVASQSDFSLSQLLMMAQERRRALLMNAYGPSVPEIASAVYPSIHPEVTASSLFSSPFTSSHLYQSSYSVFPEPQRQTTVASQLLQYAQLELVATSMDYVRVQRLLRVVNWLKEGDPNTITELELMAHHGFSLDQLLQHALQRY